MRKLFILPLALLATSAFAQPTLTSATNNPVVGDVFYGYVTDTDHVSMGASGASVTWDMSMIVVNDSDTTSYLSCAATPYCDSFPGANIVSLNSGDYVYGISGTSGIKAIGAYSSGTVVHFDDSLTLTRFPLSYGLSFNDTTHTEFSLFSTTVYITNYANSDCDAWGTLVLPTGTYNNVLRLHTTTITKDSMNIMGTPQVGINQTEEYAWFVSGFRSPLLTVGYDTSGSGTPYVSDVKYYTQGSSGSVAVRDIASKSGVLKLYPVPASSVVNVDFGTIEDDAVLTISDATGRVVHTQSVNNSTNGPLQVPLADFANGLYIARLVNGSNISSGKFTVVK